MKIKLNDVNELEVLYVLLRHIRLGQGDNLYSEAAYNLLLTVEEKASKLGIIEEDLPVLEVSFNDSEGITLEIDFKD